MKKKEIKNRLLYCYSPRFRDALVANGFPVIREGFNNKSKTKYWVFEGTPELNYYKDNLYQLERDMY